MADIDLSINNILEFSYLKESLNTNSVTIKSSNSYNEYETQEKKYIFDPQETGDYTIEYNNNTVTVNVYDKIAEYDFENQDLSNWTDSGSGGGSNITSTTSPISENYSIRVRQGRGGGTSWKTVSNDKYEFYNQDQYHFLCLVKSNNYSRGSSFLGTGFIWNGSPSGSNTIGFTLFNNDSNGNTNPFKFVGQGVDNSTDTLIDWKSNTWYWLKSKVDNKNNKAYGKVWEENNSEPDTYQIDCDITTSTTSKQPMYFSVNGKDSVNLDIIVDHFKFANGEINSFK